MKIEQVKISDLKEWDKNPRKNDTAADKLTKLIGKYGFVNPVIATPDRVIRAGHTRIKAAKKLGLKKVPVIFIDFGSETKAKGFSIADNKSMEWAEWDFSALEAVIEEIKAEDLDFDLEMIGFEADELEAIDILKDDFKEIDESKLKQIKNKCPECGFEW